MILPRTLHKVQPFLGLSKTKRLGYEASLTDRAPVMMGLLFNNARASNACNSKRLVTTRLNESHELPFQDLAAGCGSPKGNQITFAVRKSAGQD
jgi:hypothetical protein